MKLRLDRLTQLADTLEALNGFIAPKFHMGWFQRKTVPGWKYPATPTPKALTDCSTSACAAGYAATIPAFQRDGFKLTNGSPQFEGAHGYAACELFFGISPQACKSLFGGEHVHRTLDDEVQVLRRFIARKSK